MTLDNLNCFGFTKRMKITDQSVSNFFLSMNFNWLKFIYWLFFSLFSLSVTIFRRNLPALFGVPIFIKINLPVKVMRNRFFLGIKFRKAFSSKNSFIEYVTPRKSSERIPYPKKEIFIGKQVSACNAWNHTSKKMVFLQNRTIPFVGQKNTTKILLLQNRSDSVWN